MSDPAAPVSRPTTSRKTFWITAIVTFVVVLVVLALVPRGVATGESNPGESVTIELTGGINATLEPSLRDLGWRAELPSRPYQLRVRVTVVNESEELFPRWYRVTVFEADNPADGEELPREAADTLQTAHLGPGEQASTDFTLRYDRPCGEFLARISYQPTLDEEETSFVEVPFDVGNEECLAER